MRIWCPVLALTAVSAYSKHVGSRTCARCHPAQYKIFQQSPMGRSLLKFTSALSIEVGVPTQIVHAKTGRRYRVFRNAGDLLIEESFPDQSGRAVYSDLRKVSYA